MIISLIVALDENGGIGKNNKIPWHLQTDLKRFKLLTMGHHLIMGRLTFEAIGKPLSGRVMIVITHNKKYRAAGCVVLHSIDEALKYAEQNNEEEVFIIGGGDVFTQCLSLADRIYLTTIHTKVDTDVFFPKIDMENWKRISSDEIPKNAKDDYASSYKVLSRIH